MGEAFIFGSGGGATVEHIVMTDATSHTFQLTNPKRTYCKVFGVINADFNAYSGYYTGDYSYEHENRLYGNQYLVHQVNGSYRGGWSYTEKTEYDKDITITRNDGSITIDLDPSRPYYAFQKWNSDEYGEYIEKHCTNTIDIYVVDYD